MDGDQRRSIVDLIQPVDQFVDIDCAVSCSQVCTDSTASTRHAPTSTESFVPNTVRTLPILS